MNGCGFILSFDDRLLLSFQSLQLTLRRQTIDLSD
jgi:hypothetical protein